MTFVYFHGSFGYGLENWSPYLKRELELLGHSYLAKNFPCDDFSELTRAGQSVPSKEQTVTNWLDSFDQFYDSELKKVNDSVCFIGHSIAPLFILHILDKYEIQLDSAIFVSPFLRALNNDKHWQFDHVNSTFYRTNFDFTRLREQIGTSYVLYGNDDPYVPQNLFIEFAERLGSSRIEIKGGKHLSASAGFTEFPLLFELCKTRIDK